MTDTETLHDQCMTAVHNQLVENGCAPKQAEWGRVSDGEHLDAVLTYPASNAWEYGLIVFWDERTGWQYYALDEERRGTNVEDLPVEFLAAPSAVAGAVAALLADRLDTHPDSDDQWEHADQLRDAIDEEADQ